MDERTSELEGIVLSVIYRNPENGYTVLRLTTNEGTVTAVGPIPMATPGERLYMQGRWTNHASYGEQFKAEYVERSMPRESSAIFAYLSSGAVKGIGEKTARRIVDLFGSSSLEVLENEPEKLTAIKGITHEKAQQFSEAFRRQAGLRRLTEMLSAHGLSPLLAMKLYSLYAEASLEVLRDDPYILTEPRFGAAFGPVDEFAVSTGIEESDTRRAWGALLFELRHNLSNGHVFLPANKLIAASCQLLDAGEGWMADALESLIESGRVIREFVAGVDACYLPHMYEAEISVYKRFTQMTITSAEAPAHLDEVLRVIQAGLGIEYASGQLEAIRTAAASNVMLLTGGPGTGKTTTVKGILALFEHMGMRVLLAAPTGRAAKRMSELSQTGAATVHRLLGAQADAAGQTIFTKNQDNPLSADAIILDETSMVDIELMSALLKAMRPACRLIMIGDADQLPSVGAGRLLSDVIRSGTVPCVRLTDVFRQAEDSGIITAAHGVCRGEPPAKRAGGDLFFLIRPDGEDAANTVSELCSKRLPLKMGIPADQIQVITPTRKGPCGSVHLNMLLRDALNPPAKGKTEMRIGETVFRVGDRVMQSRNNYDLVWKSEGALPAGMGVFNGDIGVISEIEPFSGIMTVDYEDHLVEYTPDDLADLEPAWAITVHKAQGSEFRAVVFAVCQVPKPLEIRSLFYTGLTRARELLVLVGDEQTTARMCANDKQKNRYSGLRARLANRTNE